MGTYLALDAGGTRTRCRVADDARVLASAETGTVKLMNVGEDTATTRLRALIASALAQAGVDPQTVTRSAIGLAGSSSEAVRAWAQHVFAATVSGPLMLLGDEEIALDAAFADGAGILVIAGTGSHTIGRCAAGALASAGGWGPMIGDEGSGTWIGLEAIRSALRARDRGVETCLLAEIEAHWKLDSLPAVVAYANQRERPDFAALATVIAACAERGDALAAAVLERAGEELAASVSLVASKMSAAGCPHEDALHVAFTGSVLEKIRIVRRSFTAHLHAALPGVTLLEEAVDPLEGALWRARRG